MKCSDAALSIIQRFEGLRLKAYLCPAGVWTIGYGHTGSDVSRGLVISPERAAELLRSDLARFELGVNRIFAGVPLTQSQFDALVSLAFNIGTLALQRSTLALLVKRNPSDPAIRKEFLRWSYAGGAKLPGLIRRRTADADLYFSNH